MFKARSIRSTAWTVGVYRIGPEVNPPSLVIRYRDVPGKDSQLRKRLSQHREAGTVAPVVWGDATHRERPKIVGKPALSGSLDRRTHRGDRASVAEPAIAGVTVHRIPKQGAVIIPVQRELMPGGADLRGFGDSKRYVTAPNRALGAPISLPLGKTLSSGIGRGVERVVERNRKEIFHSELTG